MLSTSFLSLSFEEEQKCLICNKCLKNKDKVLKLTNTGWEKFKEQGKQWKGLNITEDNEYYYFTNVYDKIHNSQNSFGKLHRDCKGKFFLRYQKSKEKYGEIINEETGSFFFLFTA